jgi:choline dehydrogenase-like flavoprotein
MSTSKETSMAIRADYDVVIVGSGHAGAFMAHQLGMQKKRVLVIEAGSTTVRNREDYMENFFLSTFKSPESPYPPNANALDPEHTNAPRPTIQALVFGWNDPAKSYLTYAASPVSTPFGSTYERIAGGTGTHWMGTSLRMIPNDFSLRTLYGHGRDWPMGLYSQLANHYAVAEAFIGVSANVDAQREVGTPYPANYQYPMPGLPISVVDKLTAAAVTGPPLTEEAYSIPRTIVTQTPAGRNSIPYDNRRVCHGNTNCTPICPIQAKYDAAYGLQKALATGFVDVLYQAVVDKVTVASATGQVTGIHYITYDSVAVPASGGATGQGTVVGSLYVLAASAIENAKILLNSPTGSGGTVANTSDQVGRNLMDHPTYLAWGLFRTGQRGYGYRGPISTAGVESLRDGPFRSNRASWRIEIGNEGWNWPTGDPYTTGLDYLYGTNNGGLNSDLIVKTNVDYSGTLNDLLTRQFRIAFLVEQEADPENRVQLSPTHKDNLGIPRPMLTYRLSDYVKAGFKQARNATREYMSRLGAAEHTTTNPSSGTTFTYESETYNYAGAGHVCGTHIMGTSAADSVVDSYQRSWDHSNLYIVGCGSMPSVGSENPTLTMVAMAGRTVDQLLTRL